MKLPYDDRPIDIQIKMDKLTTFFHYPLSYYEKMSNSQVSAFYRNKRGEIAKQVVAQYKEETLPHVSRIPLF